MSPEQFTDAKTADLRSDIYSFGIILYQLISAGRYPYQMRQSKDNLILEYARIHAEEPSILLDSPLMPIINRCIAKDRTKRYQSYNKLLEDLQYIGKKAGIKLPPSPSNIGVEAEELYMQAQSFVALKQPEKALEAINEYVRLAPENYCGWTEKSRIHLERDEYNLASVHP